MLNLINLVFNCSLLRLSLYYGVSSTLWCTLYCPCIPRSTLYTAATLIDLESNGDVDRNVVEGVRTFIALPEY